METTTITFSASKQYKDKLKEISKSEGLSQSDIIRRLIDEKYNQINNND